MGPYFVCPHGVWFLFRDWVGKEFSKPNFFFFSFSSWISSEVVLMKIEIPFWLMVVTYVVMGVIIFVALPAILKPLAFGIVWGILLTKDAMEKGWL
jgi:hypothetical protein